MREIGQELGVGEPAAKKKTMLSVRGIRSRQKRPTGAGELSGAANRQRRADTFQAACEIHGATKEDLKPAVAGLVDTIEKKSPESHIVDSLSNSNKLKRAFSKLYKKELDKFESSDDNMVRSVAVYYSSGVMGKKKYRSTYKASAYKQLPSKKAVRTTVANCQIPRLVPYNKLMPFIKTIDIGKLYSVHETLCEGLEEQCKVNGCYRDLEELIIRLAKFYLTNGYKLHTFNNESNTFHVSLGGDGAPCGKDDSATAWLVGFLNIGQGILSSNENFLLFGANCTENCLPVTRFVAKILTDIQHIEKTIYPIVCNDTTINVKFVFSELPNDMKMLAFLGGELSNSATFFSSFADVCNSNIAVMNGTFGPNPSDTWKPWSYNHRLKVAKEVTNLKKKLDGQHLAASTKRSKITTFIAKQKSRQEFVPLIGEVVDRAHVEPLHLKNNACALLHRYLLYEAVANSKLSDSTSFLQVPPSCPFGVYVETMQTKCQLSRLAKRVIKWFNENKGNSSKEFDYRFTGKDSRLFLHNFMFLIDVIEVGTKGRQQHILHVLAFLCLCLRDCVSLFNRLQVSDSQVEELQVKSKDFYTALCLFHCVNPTTWTLGHIVPTHTKDMKAKYDMGLGLNSMEGREAKHISISKFCQNTLYSARWEQIFQHEYVSLIWLRERGFNVSKPPSAQSSYIPKRVTEGSGYCYCGLQKKCLEDAMCRFCCHHFRHQIKESVRTGKSLLPGVQVQKTKR